MIAKENPKYAAILNLLSESDGMPARLGLLFSSAFAAFIDELATRLSCGEAGAAPADVAPVEDASTSIEAAPDWVRESLRVSRESNQGLEASEARSRLRKRIVDQLRKRGLTQADLARLMRRDPASVSRTLKNLDRSRLETVAAIASALDIELDELVTC